jgi:hypothetical protein
LVPVPKATVNEHNLSEALENQIRLAGKSRNMKAKSVAILVDESAHEQFWLCVLAPHPAHSFAAVFR